MIIYTGKYINLLFYMEDINDKKIDRINFGFDFRDE